MKTQKKITGSVSLALLVSMLVFVGCKDDLSYYQFKFEAPTIESFYPESGPKYSDITIKGENLNYVSEAYIGGQKVTIKTKITHNELVIVANGDASGTIRLVSKLETEQSESTSTSSFSYQFVAPSINESQLSAKLEVGATALLKGTNMLASEKIYLVDASNSANTVEAIILNKTNSEVLISIPYCTYTNAKLYVTYFNGTSIVNTPSTTASPQVVILPPTITDYASSSLQEGDTFEVNGNYLDRVSKVIIGGTNVPITLKSRYQLKALISVDAFPDGANNDLSVSMEYFDGAQTLSGLPTVDVYVPELYLGADWITGYSQYPPAVTYYSGEWWRSFYQFKSGISLPSSSFATFDPTAYSFGVNGAEVANANVLDKGKVSKTEYDNTEPYIILYKLCMLYGPAAKNNYIKNYYINSAKGKIWTANGSGTPLVLFVQLFPYPNKAPAAVKTAIDAIVAPVRNGTLTKIDNTNFPIDVDNKKIGDLPLVYDNTDGIAVQSVLQTIDYDLFTSGIVSGQQNLDLQATNQDGVIMAIYYDYENGFSAANPANGIKKIGFIHVTKINTVDTNGEGKGGAVYMKTYWKKRPY